MYHGFYLYDGDIEFYEGGGKKAGETFDPFKKLMF